MALDKQTIAKRYGKALFETAKEQDVLTETSSELAQIKQVLQAEPQFVDFMTSVAIKHDAKLEMLKNLQSGTSELTSNLLAMLYDYRRIANLEDIIDEFNRLTDEDEKTVRATVTTAVELDQTRKDKIAASFAKVVGAKKVELETVVDPEIIGGVVLKSSSYVFDGSIKSKIANIKRLLLKWFLKRWDFYEH